MLTETRRQIYDILNAQTQGVLCLVTDPLSDHENRVLEALNQADHGKVAELREELSEAEFELRRLHDLIDAFGDALKKMVRADEISNESYTKLLDILE